MLFANNCTTTLNGGITAVATSMVVTSATGFPVPTGSQYFYCTLADAATQTTIEIVKVTAVSGTTFTIVRGQDGTTGTIFASGAVVSLRLVRASLQDFPLLDEANTFSGPSSTFTNAPIFSSALGVSSGGTGLTSITAGYIPYGNGTSAFNSSSNLTFDGTSLGIGTASPQDYAGYHGLTIDGTTGGNIDIRTSGSIALEIVANTATETYIKNVTSTPMWFGTANTERMRIFSSGGVSIGNTTDPGAGNLRFNTTGSNGIYFGSSTLLSDYEEGTFTPVLNRDSTSPTVTYTTQLGSYVKVGNLVTVNIYLAWSAISGGSGNYTITGLPYTCANSNAYLASSAIGFWAGITLRTLDTQLGAYSAPNTTIMYLSSNPSSNTIVTVTAGAIVLTMSYRAK